MKPYPSDKNKEKTVGIIGGMGPEATIDLMQRIVNLTPADDDIDHIRCIVDNNPKIPSRIKAIIEGNGEDPIPHLCDMAVRLEKWGADFLAIACNTTHHYHKAIQHAVKIPVLHMVELVLEEIKTHHPQISRAGILGSPAIKITGLYDTCFSRAGIALEFPDPDLQNRLFSIIRQVKTGRFDKTLMSDFYKICRHLENKGAELGIVACTELSVLNAEPPLNLIDAAQVLAVKIVQTAKNCQPLI